jgi:formate C-acetyltransferase
MTGTLSTTNQRITYADRIEALRSAKLAHTREKVEITGYKDHDDHALILPPPDRREIVKTMSSSGMPIVDCLLTGYVAKSNHPSGGFFGPKICGENFRRLMDAHPVDINPQDALLGNYMANFGSYRKPHWNPDYNYLDLIVDIEKYKLLPGIGAGQHFCQDLQIGLDLGWGGLLVKIRKYRKINSGRGQDQQKASDFYDGLEAIVLGVRDWVRRYASMARSMADSEMHPLLRENLLELAGINERLVDRPPATFHEACQWILWYQIMARMYNGSGSLGRLDVLLYAYYQKDLAAGIISEAEAVFQLACLLLHDTAYIQLGGPDETGKDATNRVSYLVLEAAHQIKIPANIGICVGEDTPPELLRRGVEIMFADKLGIPKFLGIDRTVEGFTRNHYPVELSRARAYSGCHWSAIPGREYTLNDCVKINFAAVFEVAFADMMSDSITSPSVNELWTRYEAHMQRAVNTTAKSLDFHMDHMHQVFPELVLDLLCWGPIEKGLDASHGGVEFYNLCIDGAALATVADSFAALEQRIEAERRYTWQELAVFLHENWSGPEGDKARRLMRNIPRYGSGGSLADRWAIRIARSFTEMVKASPTPAGFNLIPGIFSWANTIPMGKKIGATPNGRYAGAPISHGSNPDPGFRKDGAPTAMALAIASIQPGYGNTAPMQIDLDPGITIEEGGVDVISDLIRTHFQLGGTQINLNIMDSAQILAAHQNPDLYPDLVVRVTGFSAYFTSLSPEFRQMVVDRIISAEAI